MKIDGHFRIGLVIYAVVVAISFFGCSLKRIGTREAQGGGLGDTYFTDASEIKFIVSGKRITDKNSIAEILSYLDTSDKRRWPCACDSLNAEVTLKTGHKVIVEFTPHGWGFREDHGNVRLLKHPKEYEALYDSLWDKYGPLSGGRKK